MSDIARSQRAALDGLALILVLVGALMIVLLTPAVVVPIVSCLGLPLALIGALLFSVGWLALGSFEVGWARQVLGVAAVVLALALFFDAYLDGVGVIIEHFRDRADRPPLSALWTPAAQLGGAALALCIGAALRHPRPLRVAPLAASLLALTGAFGWALLGVLCALGLPTTA